MVHASTSSPAVTLCDLQNGQVGVVVSVEGGDDLAARIQDQGLWPGVEVHRLCNAPFGDPILFSLHGFRLALRLDEARRVRIEPRHGT